MRLASKRSSRRPRRGRAGFSLVELAAATGVLGIGLVGLVQLHTNAVRGVIQSESISRATEIANQRAEFLATMDPDDLPSCTGVPRCRQGAGIEMTSPLGTVGGYECTRFVDQDDVPRGDGTAAQEGLRYRVDTVVGPHPDVARQRDAVLLTISVCFADGSGRVQQVQTRRLLVPGA